MDIYRLAHDFIQGLPQEILEHHLDNEGPYEGRSTFDEKAVEVIADELQAFIASVVASLIDAGSERDAIMEDEMLNAELTRLLKEW